MTVISKYVDTTNLQFRTGVQFDAFGLEHATQLIKELSAQQFAMHENSLSRVACRWIVAFRIAH